MPTAPIDVDPDAYVSAADRFLQVNGAVCDLVAEAAGAAGAGGGMAGSDTGGVDWAAAYDDAAASALTTAATLADSLGHLGDLLATSAANHAGADAASVPGGPPDYPGEGGGRGATTVLPATPPSANGTAADPPAGWFLVAHLLQYTWPNGHQDQLHTVAAGWTTAADALEAEADRLSGPIGDISALRSPEVDDAVATCCEVQQSARDLSATFRTLSSSCTQYAAHLDDAHSQILRELAQLVAESAVLQAVSAIVAAPTAGGSEVAGQAAQGARVGLAVTRISAVLAKLMALVRAVVAVIRAVVTRIAAVLGRLKVVLGKGGDRAVAKLADSAELSRLPDLASSLRQLESKFKHASDFGVLLPRGRASFEAFGRALDAFVRRPTTIRVSRPYRGQPAILNYDPVSRLAVVQTPSGEFVTGWRMSELQWQNVMNGRPLSGS